MSKQALFLHFQMAQQTAAQPLVYTWPPPGSHFLIQVLYYCMFLGISLAPMHILITLHVVLATGHWKNKWSMDSCVVKNWHMGSPTQCLLIRLSLVRMALCLMSHMNVLIFNGIFAFQNFLFGESVSSPNMWEYKDLIEKLPFLFYSHFGLCSISVIYSKDSLLVGLI